MKIAELLKMTLFLKVIRSFSIAGICFLFFNGCFVNAQDVSINWVKNIQNEEGGATRQLSSIIKKQEIVNGKLVEVAGFIGVGNVVATDKTVTGYKGGLSDIWLVEFSGSGEIISSIALGGSGTDFGNKIISTSDGGYVITGRTTSNDGDVSGWNEGYYSGNDKKYDFWIVKVKEGKIQWQKTFGTESDETGECIVRETKDAGFIAAATIKDDIWVRRLDFKGDQVWEKKFGTDGRDWIHDMVLYKEINNEEGIAILGHDGRDASKSNRIWLLQLWGWGDKNKDTYYGSGANDRGVSLVATPDEGFLIVATKGAFPYDYFIIKTNGVPWIKTVYGGTKSEVPVKVKVNKDGTYTILGYTFSDDGDVMGFHPNKEGKETEDIWLLNINNRGDITWHKSLGGSDIDRPIDIIDDGDNLLIPSVSLSKDGDFQKFSNSFSSAAYRLINLTPPACNYKIQSVGVQHKTKSTSGKITFTTNIPPGKGRVTYAKINNSALTTYGPNYETENGILTFSIGDAGTYSHFVVRPAESACTLVDYREIEIKEVEEVCDFSKFVLKSASGSMELCKGSFLTLRVDIPYSSCKVTKYEWFKNDVKLSSIQDFLPVNEPGKYAVVIYDSDNKSYKLDAVTVTEKECNTGTPLTATISSTATTAYAPQTIILTANTGTGYTYQWRRNGTNIAGATGATYEAKESGTYTVVITANGQSVTSNSIVLVVQVPLAKEPEVSGIEVNIFPNPAERQVNAEIRLPAELAVRVEIYTADGRRVKEWYSESKNFVHRPVIALGNGLEGQQLLLKVSTDKSFVTKKILVK